MLGLCVFQDLGHHMGDKFWDFTIVVYRGFLVLWWLHAVALRPKKV